MPPTRTASSSRADGPIGLDVRYDLRPADSGQPRSRRRSAVRRGGGLTGRLLAQATDALLAAGALDGAARSIARAAETATPALALTRQGEALR